MSAPVMFSTTVRTASEDTNMANNVRLNQATVRIPADTSISGNSIPDKLTVVRGAPEDEASPRKISHVYELFNRGPAVLKRATVMLTIPTGNLTADQVALDRVEVEGSDGGRAKCRRISTSQNMSQDEPAGQMADQRLGSCSDSSCYSVRCTVKSLEHSQTILFRADMMLAAGAEDLVQASEITLQTTAEISFPDDTIFRESSLSNRDVKVSTVISLEEYVAPESTPEGTPEPESNGEGSPEPEAQPESEAEPTSEPGAGAENEPDTGETAQAEEGPEGAASTPGPIIPLLVILTILSKICL